MSSQFLPSVSPAALRKASALEALVGHLHLTDAPRLEQVMAWLLQRMDGSTALCP